MQQAREALQLTQVQLAQLAEVSVSHISKVESSNGRFGALMLYKLAAVLKVSRRWLETGEGPRECGAEERRMIMDKYPEGWEESHELREKQAACDAKRDTTYATIIDLMLDAEKQKQAKIVSDALKLSLSRAWQIVIREHVTKG